jgi:ABC-type lipoprotein release transport system permease subunit
MLARTWVLVRIALANITSSLLNFFVGFVLLFGAALLVVGGSLFSTLDNALSKSIVESITGHLQVYGARSKDPLEVYGKVDGSDVNLSPIDDFSALHKLLAGVPNVKTVVPMGGATTQIGSSTTVDQVLERLRTLLRTQETSPQPDFETKRAALIAHARHLVEVVAKDLDSTTALTVASADTEAERAALASARSPEFWARFDTHPLEQLEFLENKVAPLVGDADLIFLRVLGTDLDRYQKTFSRLRLVEGGPVPEGHRGLLLPRFFVEEFFKLKSARRLDKMKSAIETGRRVSDLTDQELQRFKRENMNQTREFVLQLDGPGTAAVIAALKDHLKSDKTTLTELLSSFFDVDDANFKTRYAFFYERLAPLLTLYRVKVGDEMTLRSFGKSGSVETAVLKLYGIFELSGLEKSPLAGVNGLVDLLTFRDLYGYLTPEKQAELVALKEQSKAKAVSREDAEAALFGGDGELVEEVKAQTVEAPTASAEVRAARRARVDTFTQEELEAGVVLNAAILLDDSSPLAQVETRKAIEQALAASAPPVDAALVSKAKALQDLPMSLRGPVAALVAREERRAQGQWEPPTDMVLEVQAALKRERAALTADTVGVLQNLMAQSRPTAWVVGWASAAGFLGSFIQFFRGALVAIVMAFSFVALVVVTIGMTIATLQRTATIGTMRAIGAQRGFVVAMVLVETVVLACVFGGIGTLIGSLIVQALHARGIPAFRDELYFFFSGPVLRPELTPGGIAIAFGVTLVVSLLAVLVPTVMATRVAPVTAMRGSE